MSLEEMGDNLVAIGQLDWSLIDMIRNAMAAVRGMYGADLWEADIRWDFPAQENGDRWTERDATVSHAIGFICGIAALSDVTPLELCDTVDHLGPSPTEKDEAITAGDESPEDHAGHGGSCGLVACTQQHERESAAAKPRTKRKTSQRRQKLRKVR